MSGMCLHHHRASRGESRHDVVPEDAEAEWEVARAEDGDDTDGDIAPHDGRSAAKVIETHTGQFTLETVIAESRLQGGQLDQFGGGREHVIDRGNDPALADRRGEVG